VTLLRAASLSLAFGSRTIFRDLTLVVEEGERVGLVGVNGSGKSSLMKILAGAMPPDTGELQLRRGAAVTYLPQEPSFAPGATVESELSAANPALRDALDAHAALSGRLERGPAGERELEQLSELSHRIEQLGGWDTAHEARTLLDRLGVKEWDRPLHELSGGTRKRVAVARALLTKPDLLLLDEPTNHLDADTVDWVEEELDRLSGALLLVTHDRYFLDDLVDRMVEISPGEGLVSYPGNYQAFLEAKAVEREQAELQAHKRERWISQEVAWLRRAPEARRTKSKARIERARKLMSEKGLARKETAALQTAAAPRLGHTVIEARGVAKSFDGRRVIEGVDLILQRGERIGIVGRNGAGKTTFLRVLLGELPADAGEVTVGKNTSIAYYDQQRAQLDPEWTVYESALGERIRGDVRQSEDYIDLSGRRILLRDYLDDLLFPVPMQKMQVKALSGGERNRLLLARLFLQGANVLILDEPTNDLDLVTLNVLEQLLLQFTGSALLVTHDRYFLDKVATAILAFDGEGHAIRYPGNYETYAALRPAPAAASAPVKPAPEKRPKPRKPGKLSFKEQRELESMESLIEAAEAAKAEAETKLSDPQTYAREPHRVPELQRELERSSAEAERLYARWQELQDRQAE
jgi:ABC transport system ATP-binding/permease protein